MHRKGGFRCGNAAAPSRRVSSAGQPVSGSGHGESAAPDAVPVPGGPSVSLEGERGWDCGGSHRRDQAREGGSREEEARSPRERPDIPWAHTVEE